MSKIRNQVFIIGIFLLMTGQTVESQEEKTLVINGIVKANHWQNYSSHVSKSRMIKVRKDRLLINIWIDGARSPLKCSVTESTSDASVLCAIRIPPTASLARIEIAAPGFLKFSRNLILPQKNAQTIDLDVGTIELLPAPLPIIKQITLGIHDDGRYRFRLTIHNPLKEEILVEKIRLVARRRQGGIDCNQPAGIKLSISDKISMITGEENITKLEGSYRDLADNASVSYKVYGFFQEDYCAGTAVLTLTLATDFILKSEENVKADILLPAKLAVYKAENFDGRPDTITELMVDTFTDYRFNFVISESVGLEFNGDYYK